MRACMHTHGWTMTTRGIHRTCTRDFCCRDLEVDPKTGKPLKTAKVKPTLDLLQKHFRSLWDVSQEVGVDEMTVLW